MRIINSIQKIGITCSLITLPVLSARAVINQPAKDTFVKMETPIPPKGSSEKSVLLNAPNPFINIAGEDKTAKFVVDLSSNTLYSYNTFGEAEKAFSVASGKKSTPTEKGIRIVTHVETYPYRTAPRSTKRRRNPGAYGPKIICLNKIDQLTGEQSQTGEFIHGTNNLSSIGKYISQGCIRMDNEVIKQLSEEVKRGDIIIIK